MTLARRRSLRWSDFIALSLVPLMSPQGGAAKERY